MLARIYADFNNILDDERGERVLVGVEGTWQIEQYRSVNWLVPGRVVKLYDDELEVEGTLEYDEQTKWWYVRPDWSTRRDLNTMADGWSDYQNATPHEKLIILQVEALPRARIMRQYVDNIKVVAPGIVERLPDDLIRQLDGLVETAEDLKQILEILARV